MRSRTPKTAVAAVLLAALLVLPPFPPPVSAQETEKTAAVDRLNGAFFKNLGRDFAAVATSPVRWKSADLLTFAAVLGTGAILYGFDRDVYDWVQANRSETSIDASPVISKFGNGGYLTAFIAALYAGGEAFDEPGLRRTALLSLESFLTASVLTFGLKAVAGRARPYAGESSASFHPFSFQSRYVSFPSGDAAGAFAVATAIARETPGVAVDILAYTLAGLVAVYRVHDRKHWPSDVFVGSALGYFVASKISALNKRGSGKDYHVSFQLNPRCQSVTLTVYF